MGSKGRAPKHRQTQYASISQQDRMLVSQEDQDLLDCLRRLEGKTIKLKTRGLTTPSRKITEVRIAFDDELGKVVMLDGDQAMPLKMPDNIFEKENKLTLIYEKNINENDPNAVFRANNKPDRKTPLDSEIIIEIVD